MLERKIEEKQNEDHDIILMLLLILFLLLLLLLVLLLLCRVLLWSVLDYPITLPGMDPVIKRWTKERGQCGTKSKKESYCYLPQRECSACRGRSAEPSKKAYASLDPTPRFCQNPYPTVKLFFFS